ncbi:MAG TPA: NAD(P)-binding protein, partial [Candidatus Berkiella sp.]|nr:NAD(P)-binding protein [Candidatus Berkiella sp.]
MKKTEQHIVIGLGITGLSCARFLSRHQLPFAVMDSRENPLNLALFRQTYPGVAVYTGTTWPQSLLNEA